MNPKRLRRLAALMSAGVLVTGGAAVAASGSLPDLPGEAQAGEHVTTDTADQDGEDAGQASVQDDAEDGIETKDDAEAQADPAANDHGQEVSTFAQETSLEGRAKGQAIAELASSNRQDDGQAATAGDTEDADDDEGELSSEEADRDDGDEADDADGVEDADADSDDDADDGDAEGSEETGEEAAEDGRANADRDDS